MLRSVLNDEHLTAALREVIRPCRHRLLIATADVKNLHIPPAGGGRGRKARSILRIFDDLTLIDPVADMLDGIWRGARCTDCGRKDHCPVPLEEPDL